MVPEGVGKGRPRFGEGGSDGRAPVACIASLGKGLVDPGDGLSADLLVKDKIVALAVDG